MRIRYMVIFFCFWYLYIIVSPFPFSSFFLSFFLIFHLSVRVFEEQIQSYKVGYRYRIGTDYRSPLDIYLCR